MSFCFPRMCDYMDWVILDSSSLWDSVSRRVSCYILDGSSQFMRVFRESEGFFNSCSIAWIYIYITLYPNTQIHHTHI
jgi:hypothetical protein